VVVEFQFMTERKTLIKIAMKSINDWAIQWIG
jgi:hypothetical protein